MSFKTWWLFVVVTFFLSATPGPNMLLVMATSARRGFSKAVATMAGCMTALLAMMSLSSLGLGALLQAFPSVFTVLRWAGAGYLVYLGIKSWLATVPEQAAATAAAAGSDAATGSGAAKFATAATAPVPGHESRRLYRQGVLVAASNPKAILFAAAFLPQFIRPDAAKLPQFLILLATFAVIEISWYVLYAASGRRLASYLARPSVLKAFNRVTGTVFILFAGLMALAHEGS